MKQTAIDLLVFKVLFLLLVVVTRDYCDYHGLYITLFSSTEKVLEYSWYFHQDRLQVPKGNELRRAAQTL